MQRQLLLHGAVRQWRRVARGTYNSHGESGVFSAWGLRRASLVRGGLASDGMVCVSGWSGPQPAAPGHRLGLAASPSPQVCLPSSLPLLPSCPSAWSELPPSPLQWPRQGSSTGTTSTGITGSERNSCSSASCFLSLVNFPENGAGGGGGSEQFAVIS